MNNQVKVMYEYFLRGKPGNVFKIPKNKKEHKSQLLKKIQKRYPGFMHPYAFMAGPMPKHYGEEIKSIIDLFENNKPKRFNFLSRIRNLFKNKSQKEN